MQVMGERERQIVDACAARLLEVNPHTPWMTAAGLARDLGRFSAKEIESTLSAHAKGQERRVRHSHFPSKTNLAILWGNVGVVGEMRSLAPLELCDGPRREDATEKELSAPLDLPTVFISHNRRDKALALSLKQALGDDIPAWVCWEEISLGQTIAHEVRAGVERARVFISVVSRNSLGSVWVRKEFLGALNFGRAAICIVLPCNNDSDLAPLQADGPVRRRQPLRQG